MFSIDTDKLPFASLASVAEDTIIYAVGDIHGCAYLLDDLHQKIISHAAEQPETNRTIIYMGDYIDRGLESCDVIERMVNGTPEGFKPIYLLGNHEWVMLRFLEGLKGSEAWFDWGGLKTLQSYGVRVDNPPFSNGDIGRMRESLQKVLPETHLHFLEQLQLYHKEGDFLFVHAGIEPEKPLVAQNPETMLFIRDPFLYSPSPPPMPVIFGHTIFPEPFLAENRIGIDTGAFASGILTSLCICRRGFDFIHT